MFAPYHQVSLLLSNGVFITPCELTRPLPYHENVNVRSLGSRLGLPQLGTAGRLALVAIAILLLIIFARLLGSSAFLWVGLAGLPFLLGYARLATRGFLLLGAVLVGSSVGILFEANLAWDGAYLASVGAALAATEALAPTDARLTLLLGVILTGLGVGLGLFATGGAPLIVFVCLALATGVLIFLRRRRAP